MNLDLVNDLFSNLKENKLVQNFMKELSNYLEKNLSNNNFSSNSWIDLSNDDLTIFDTKITTKFNFSYKAGSILVTLLKATLEKDYIYYLEELLEVIYNLKFQV